MSEEVGEGERGGGPEKGVRVDDDHDEADVICTRRRVASERMSSCALKRRGVAEYDDDARVAGGSPE